MDPRVAEHWGLIPTPVGRRAEYHGPQHAEALARLHYAVEQRLAVVHLAGPVGGGKSWLTQRLACELLGSGRQVASVTLAGRETAEWLADLTLALQRPTAGDESPATLWRDLADRLSGLQQTQRGVVVIADQVEGASLESRSHLARLARLLATRGTLVLVESLPAGGDPTASRSGDPTRWTADSLTELIDLPVTLPWLPPQEMGACLAAAWPRETGRGALATPQACDRLHRATGGSLRRLARLVPLCLAAGLAFDIETIDAELVTEAAGELQIPVQPSLPTPTTNEPALTE